MEKFKSILKGIIFAFAITIILLLLFSIILVKTNFREQYINAVIIVISSFSIFIGAIISTIKSKQYGIINGIIVSATYMFSLYIFSSILNNNFSLNVSSLIINLFGVILGIIGGIVGANIKS